MAEQYFIRADDAYQIAWEAIRSWQVDFLSGLADERGCGLLPGQAWMALDGDKDNPNMFFFDPNGDEPSHLPIKDFNPDWWVFPKPITDDFKSLATTDKTQVETVKTERSEKYFGIISHESAHKIVESALEGCVKGVEKYIHHRMTHHAGEHGQYRMLAMNERSHAAGTRAMAHVKEKILRVVLKKKVRRRRGVQVVSTSSRRVPEFGWFKFSGMWAYRARPGRQALPKSVWLARYKARLAKRSKTGRKRKGKGVAVPALDYERPKRVKNLARKSEKPTYFDSSEAPDLDSTVFEPSPFQG